MRFDTRLFLRSFDWALLATTLLILGFGVLMLFSTSRTQGGEAAYHLRQLVWCAIGLSALAVAYAVPFRHFDTLAIPIYLLALGSLVYLILIPHAGAGRWLPLGPFRFQPSEAAKIALILILARILSDRPPEKLTLKHFLLPLAVAGVPFLLVLRQPDLGTALAFGAILLPMLFWAGLPERVILLALSLLVALLASTHVFAWVVFLFILFALLLVLHSSLPFLVLALGLNMLVGISAPIAWNQLKDYQQRRVLTFLDPNLEPLGAGYQIIQSEVAIGSGGFAGKGFLKGTQKGLSFLPEQHTDFIFSVVGEEFGFLGCALLLSLFLFLLLRVLLIAMRTRNRFASLMVVGVFGFLSFQIMVNVGMTLGLVPVTGLPLPLVSYGGSSLTTSLFALGIVLGVGLRRRRY